MEPEDQIKELTKRVSDLKSEKVKRPNTKLEYIALLVSLDEQITELKEQIADLDRAPKPVITYTVPIIVTDDEKWKAIRGNRNTDLSGNDWTHIPDNQLSEKKRKEWAAYRQALRDIPQQTTGLIKKVPVNPDDVVWPVRPL